MRFTFILFFAFLSSVLMAQPNKPQIAYYSFNDCANIVRDDSKNKNSALTSNIAPGCECGVIGNAIQLTGEQYILLVDASTKITTKDFAISFYFKPTAIIGERAILSKRESCTAAEAFDVLYNASSKSVNVLLKDAKTKVTVSGKIDPQVCWQHVVLVRSNSQLLLYINGKLRDKGATGNGFRINLAGNSILTVGKSFCDPTVANSHFQGYIDELRIYDDLLVADEVSELYVKPDNITTQDTLIFLGNSIQAHTANTCANDFRWSPKGTISDITIANPVITPTENSTYVLRFMNGTCSSFDTLKVRVVDPNNVECTDVFLANAFTPNDDGRNDKFGIDNPYNIQSLINFEILDRWNGIVFQTDNLFNRWDGTLNGVALNPGVYLYRIRYKCKEEEKIKMGSFSLLR